MCKWHIATLTQTIHAQLFYYAKQLTKCENNGCLLKKKMKNENSFVYIFKPMIKRSLCDSFNEMKTFFFSRNNEYYLKLKEENKNYRSRLW